MYYSKIYVSEIKTDGTMFEVMKITLCFVFLKSIISFYIYIYIYNNDLRHQ